MKARRMQCAYCGLRGEIGLADPSGDEAGPRIFRHLGHNPFSGHLHYQCPSCEIILLVDPMDVLAEPRVDGIPFSSERPTSLGEMLSRFLQRITIVHPVSPRGFPDADPDAMNERAFDCRHLGA